MTIETKYNIGQEVWYKGFKEIFHDRISNIRIDVDCLREIQIYHELWGNATKELLKSM